MMFSRLVYFEWIDTTAGDKSWTGYDEAKSTNIHGCQAAGLFVSEDDEKIVLALLNDSDGEEVSEYAAIPKVCIKEDSRIDINLLEPRRGRSKES